MGNGTCYESELTCGPALENCHSRLSEAGGLLVRFSKLWRTDSCPSVPPDTWWTVLSKMGPSPFSLAVLAVWLWHSSRRDGSVFSPLASEQACAYSESDSMWSPRLDHKWWCDFRLVLLRCLLLETCRWRDPHGKERRPQATALAELQPATFPALLGLWVSHPGSGFFSQATELMLDAAETNLLCWAPPQLRICGLNKWSLLF